MPCRWAAPAVERAARTAHESGSEGGTGRAAGPGALGSANWARISARTARSIASVSRRSTRRSASSAERPSPSSFSRRAQGRGVGVAQQPVGGRGRDRVGEPGLVVAEAREARRQAREPEPAPVLDRRAQLRAFVARQRRPRLRGALDPLREPLVQPVRAIAAGLLAEQRVRVLVHEQRAQLAGRVRGGHDVDAAVEEADRLEAEAMAVRLQVAGAPVEHDAHGLGGHGAELRADEGAHVVEIARDGGGEVRAAGGEQRLVGLDVEVADARDPPGAARPLGSTTSGGARPRCARGGARRRRARRRSGRPPTRGRRCRWTSAWSRCPRRPSRMASTKCASARSGSWRSTSRSSIAARAVSPRSRSSSAARRLRTCRSASLLEPPSVGGERLAERVAAPEQAQVAGVAGGAGPAAARPGRRSRG